MPQRKYNRIPTALDEDVLQYHRCILVVQDPNTGNILKYVVALSMGVDLPSSRISAAATLRPQECLHWSNLAHPLFSIMQCMFSLQLQRWCKFGPGGTFGELLSESQSLQKCMSADLQRPENRHRPSWRCAAVLEFAGREVR